MAGEVSADEQSQQPTAISRDQVERWLVSKETVGTGWVAAFGTSVEEVQKIVQTGVIRPTSPGSLGLPYQQELGPNVYYALPVLAQLKTLRPDIYQHIAQQMENPEQLRQQEELHATPAAVIESAQSYAFWNALEDGFRARTGIKAPWDAIATLAYQLLPEQTESNVDEVYPLYDVLTKRNKQKADEIRQSHDATSLESALGEILTYRGVIVLYGAKFLEHGIAGQEDELEMMATPPEPFAARDVIVGIIPLTEHERDLILAMPTG